MIRPIPVAISARIAAIRLPVPGALYHLPQMLSWRLTQIAGDLPPREGLADRVVTLFHDLSPASVYRLEIDGLEPFQFRTAPCAGLVDAVAFGLIEGAAPDDLDTASRNASALAAALATVPSGGTLRIEPGEWITMPLRLGGHITLHLARNAVLRAPSLRAGWPILPARGSLGRMLGSWEGMPDACFAAPVHAMEARNLVIEGRGTIDGSGAEGDWWTWPKETRDGARRPRGLHLIGCENVTLLGFTIRNAASWTIHPQGCSNIVAAGLVIEAPHDSPNTDGLNPEGCTDVRLEGIRFSVGDDCIAIKAGKRGPNGEADHLRGTRNVEVRHCRMERGHGGVVIGSEMSGGVASVTVEDCEMKGTDRGLRLKTRRGRGGSITGITMRRVRMDGVLTALSANAHYHCDSDGHDEWVQSRKPAAVDNRTPAIDGITIEDLDVYNLSHAAGVFLGLPERPIRNIVIRRLRIHSLDPDATAQPPIMADDIRPILHETILAEHADVDCDQPELRSMNSISTSLRAAS
ncbi:polygalacturonase [Pseudorhizobium endolithicum]|uniref:Polygalacturonase n=1 Tax=Pseudorhizobium endolithicum TaxID=1191678 RepID=A0ABN7K0R2_9HYPH|nr:glycoside hydrolase family 28 protein [Pseudorhizobium endolithicum]CAD7055152.1 polygalacturonase [Pseudorhizobium endolithicum]